ncbi:PTS sugar transporter subunit IIA [Aquabacterium sp.]|uniref:PTS sugar transporter subunit IIA n=1 Tax=Aquabacterium sp. TaxID=1872578 RepID=UPI002CE6EB78|nr:PTS fructose transporter subunit IIA [Aquabacterium sp.]HSW07773.1 PTS fructose transporter subunit IIA [Aquabacterium sp.]
MPHLLVIAHTPLASALQAVAAHLFPEAAAGMAVCDVDADQAPEAVEQQAAALLASFGEAEVLILTDVFGATPCNVARRLGDRVGVRVLVGVNVPMLWRALGHLQEPLDKVAALAVAGATQGVMQLANSRPQNQAQKPANHDPDIHQHQQ